MIWRDGNRIVFRYNRWHSLSTPIEDQNTFDDKVQIWASIYLSDAYEKVCALFLLDYIWFLIDEGIDKQIIRENRLFKLRQFRLQEERERFSILPSWEAHPHA